MRTCDAIGVLEINVVGTRGSFKRPRGISGGSANYVEVCAHRTVSDAVLGLKAQGFQIIAAHLSERSVDYRSLDYTGPTALLLGSELRGLHPEAAALADRHASDPDARAGDLAERVGRRGPVPV